MVHRGHKKRDPVELSLEECVKVNLKVIVHPKK
jgi:hypothetical protein